MYSSFTNLYLLCLSFFLIPIISFAQDDNEAIESKLPHLLSTSNVGTKFMLTLPPPYLESHLSSNHIALYAISSEATTVNVKNGNGLNKSKSAKANELIIIELTVEEASAHVHLPTSNVPRAKVYKGKGLEVTSDAPIVLYFMVRFRYTSDGYLAIPEEGLGKEYIAATMPELGYQFPYSFAPWITVVGTEDNTTVKMTAGGGSIEETAIYFEEGPKLEAGDTSSFVLNRGDVFLAASMGRHSDISGTKIESDKNVAFVTGHYCNKIPLEVIACDYSVEMPYPSSTWGFYYPIPAITHRLKSGFVTVMAKDSNTTVYRDGKFFCKIDIPGGGTDAENAYYHTRIWDSDTNYSKQAMLSSNNPISVMYFNPGKNDDGVFTDPYWMNITPIEQFDDAMASFVPNRILKDSANPHVDSTQGFLDNYVNLVFECDENGLIPEDLQWSDLSITPQTWISAREIFKNPINYFWKDPSDPELKQYANTVAYLSRQALYSIRSLNGKSKFTAYSYGDTEYDSYGFPTAARFKLIKANSDIKVLNNTNRICVGNEKLIPMKISNTGEDAFIVKNVKIESNESYINWQLTANKDYPSFTLEAKKDTIIYVQFSPLEPIQYASFEITVQTDELKLNKSSTKIYLSSYEVQVNSKAQLDLEQISYGKSSGYKIIYNTENIDISESSIEALDVEIKYNDEFIKADLSSLRLLGKFEDNFTILNKANIQPQRLSSGEMQIKFSIKSIANQIIDNSYKDMLALNFDAYLPSEGRNLVEADRHIVISHKILEKDLCTFDSAQSISLDLDIICADNLRHLVQGEGYYLQKINQIITDNQSISLDYSIGFDDFTLLRIIDLEGNVVKEAVNSYQSAGKHTIEIPISKLSSGLYFYQLRSANFIETYQIMIRK